MLSSLIIVHVEAIELQHILLMSGLGCWADLLFVDVEFFCCNSPFFFQGFG